MKRVIIVGTGFAGLHAARELSGSGLEIVLVDRENYHLFQPLLYQVATAGLEQESIAYPARAMVRRWKGVSFRLAEVCCVDFPRRSLVTAVGEMEYDYLILAAGSVTNFFGMENVERISYDLKRLDHAAELRSQILGSFEKAAREEEGERRRDLLTFAIVGGGPTGVEFAGALAELVHFVLARDYPELPVHQCRIVLVEAGDSLLPALPEPLREYARTQLQKMGVEVLLGQRVVDAEPEVLHLAGGSRLGAHTVFWSAGVQAAPLAAALPLPRGSHGRIVVQPDLSVEGHPEVFVAGDMALALQDGAPLGMVAPVAMQQGRHAARAVLARERGEQPSPFRFHDRGTMATIGRKAAVAVIRGRTFSGFLAWLLWLGLHLFYLIGFRNRLLVLLNWGYYYLFYERQVRLITREGEGGRCG